MDKNILKLAHEIPISKENIATGQKYFDCRYNDIFTISTPTPPVNDDADLSDEDFKDYVLADWLSDNVDRYILTYEKGKVETCRINWLLHHISAKQFIPKPN